LACIKILNLKSSREVIMARKRATRIRCPICKKSVKAGDPEFPFCSERCRTIDLGKWASGQYVISSPVADIEEEIASEGSHETPDE
jgi:uncharacterized protein